MQLSHASNFEAWKIQQQKHDQRLAEQYSKPQASVTHQVKTTPQQMLRAVPDSNTAQTLGGAVRININQANAQEISAKLDGIGLKKAQAIIEYREQHGEFKRIDDLKNVKGIGEKTLAKNRAKIMLRPRD